MVFIFCPEIWPQQAHELSLGSINTAAFLGCRGTSCTPAAPSCRKERRGRTYTKCFPQESPSLEEPEPQCAFDGKHGRTLTVTPTDFTTGSWETKGGKVIHNDGGGIRGIKLIFLQGCQGRKKKENCLKIPHPHFIRNGKEPHGFTLGSLNVMLKSVSVKSEKDKRPTGRCVSQRWRLDETQKWWNTSFHTGRSFLFLSWKLWIKLLGCTCMYCIRLLLPLDIRYVFH